MLFFNFKILKIEHLNLKFSLRVFSCFIDIAAKKEKITNSFRNANYEDQLSKVVKSNESLVMDA